MQMNITRLRERVYAAIESKAGNAYSVIESGEHKKYANNSMLENAFEYAMSQHLGIELPPNAKVEFTGQCILSIESKGCDVESIIKKTLSGDFDGRIVDLFLEKYVNSIYDEEINRKMMPLKNFVAKHI